jgi:hypothetical protein
LWLNNALLSITSTLSFNTKLRFRQWIKLEELKERTIKAAEESSAEFPEYLLDFLSAALKLNKKYICNASWISLAKTFYKISKWSFPVTNLPIMMLTAKDNRPKEAWEYEGRQWNVWSHLLAKHYGWTLEYISNLHVDEALGKIQEILTDEQLAREFQWGMSPNAYSYDERSKQSNLVPLDRPYWMKKKLQPIKKFKMPKDLLPIGNVDYNAVDEESKPKAINSSGNVEGISDSKAYGI